MSPEDLCPSCGHKMKYHFDKCASCYCRGEECKAMKEKK
jgi:hypothetical protein